MLTGKELGAAIDRARVLKGLSKKSLADHFKVKPPSVQGWINNGRIDKSKLMEMIDFFSDVVDYSHWGLRKGFAAEASIVGPISAWDDDTPLDEDEVAIPLLKDVKVAAGSGHTADEFDSGKKIRMGKYTLRNQGVQFDKAVCVTVRGNSMEPALPEGSTVGVNLGATAVKDGKVYVIRQDGELRVKQLYRLPGDGMRLRSFNRAEHEDEDYSAQQLTEKDISVMGKVFWSSVLWD